MNIEQASEAIRLSVGPIRIDTARIVAGRLIGLSAFNLSELTEVKKCLGDALVSKDEQEATPLIREALSKINFLIERWTF